MCNLIEYNKNYKKTTDSLRNYYRDKPNNPPADNYNADPLNNSAWFEYKNNIIGKTPNNNGNDNNETKMLKLLYH